MVVIWPAGIFFLCLEYISKIPTLNWHFWWYWVESAWFELCQHLIVLLTKVDQAIVYVLATFLVLYDSDNCLQSYTPLAARLISISLCALCRTCVFFQGNYLNADEVQRGIFFAIERIVPIFATLCPLELALWFRNTSLSLRVHLTAVFENVRF